MRSPKRAGLTLIELILATGLLSVGVLSLTSIVLTSQAVQRGSSERTMARQAVHARIAELRALLRAGTPLQFDEVLDLDGTSQDLTLVPGAPAGTLVIETFKTGSSDLAEAAANVALASFGITNVDVNGDGTVDEAAVPLTELKVIPVVVRITWQSGTWRPGTADAPNAANTGQDAELAMAALLY